MVTEELYIIAIELGSSKMTGIGGKRLADGSFEIKGLAVENSSAFMRNGAIFNLDKAVNSVKKIISDLEGQLERTVTQVYIGNGGQGLHSINKAVSRRFEAVKPISPEVVSELMNENSNMDLDNLEILEAVAQEYSVGTQKQIDPVGVLSDHIEGHFVNIVARPSLRGSINDCMKQVGKGIVEYKCTPLTVADEVLSNDDKRSGCVLVDFGADTTAVSIYKGGLLRYLSVIPLGSGSITKDIASLQMTESDAEQLKVSYGYTGGGLADVEGEMPAYTLSDGEIITKRVLAEVIDARLEEIMVNVKDQITASNYPPNLLMGGAVLIGGGANLKNITLAFKNFVPGINKVSVVKSTQTNVRTQAVKGPLRSSLENGAFIAAISILAKGKQPCTGIITEDRKPEDLFNDTTSVAQEHVTPSIDEPAIATVETTSEVKKPKKPKKHKGPGVMSRAWKWIKDFADEVAEDD
jgi:cell division protein FtsA